MRRFIVGLALGLTLGAAAMAAASSDDFVRAWILGSILATPIAPAPLINPYGSQWPPGVVPVMPVWPCY